MAQNLKDLAGRLPSGPRGMGTALKLLLGAGAVAYGVRESVFTGEQPLPALRTPPTPARPLPCPSGSPPSPRPSPRPPPREVSNVLSAAFWPDPHPSPHSGRRAQSHFL